MFNKLIRRISYSIIPRPDRPWEEDPTSNAPTRRKRRISSTEPETTHEQEQQGKKKKIRGDSESKHSFDNDHPAASTTATKEKTTGDSTTPEVYADNDEDAVQREGSIEVKSVTQGVKEVELDDKPHVTEETTTTTTDSHVETQNTVDDVTGVESATTVTQADVMIHPESVPLPGGEDDELDDSASSSPSPTKEEDSAAPPDETTTEEPVEASREVTTEEPPSISSPDKSLHTHASTSPRKLPSQSPQELFTPV